MRIDVMGVGFDNVTLSQAGDRAAALLEAPGFHYIVTPNPEIVTLARQDGAFSAVLDRADLVLPDGIGIIYASRILRRPLRERVPGIDLAALLMQTMAARGGRLFLLGARPGVAEAAGHTLVGRYPGLIICGTHDGYFSDDGAVVEIIRRSRADAAFVCLGFPRQEHWMAEHGPQTGVRLMAGLGGALDVFSGAVERAPERWQRLGLEWLFRLKQEPARIGRMAKLPLFLVSALTARLRGR